MNPDDSVNEAWAIGGWLEYRSGWLWDTFAMGAVGYTSQPLYAPDDKDGTQLLAPDRKGSRCSAKPMASCATRTMHC